MSLQVLAIEMLQQALKSQRRARVLMDMLLSQQQDQPDEFLRQQHILQQQELLRRQLAEQRALLLSQFSEQQRLAASVPMLPLDEVVEQPMQTAGAVMGEQGGQPQGGLGFEDPG